MRGRGRKRQVLAAATHSLLPLPVLFSLFQLLGEEAFCRQPAQQIPEQGQGCS